MLHIAIFGPQQHRQTSHAGLVAITPAPTGWHTVDPPDAPSEGDYLECLPTDDGYTLLVECDHAMNATWGEKVPRGTRLPIDSGVHVAVGDTHIEILNDSAPCDDRELEPLSSTEYGHERSSGQSGPAASTIARWLEALATLHRWPASRCEFYEDAALFAVDPIGLDGAMLLRTAGPGEWNIVASRLPHPAAGVAYQPQLVEQAARAGHTLFHSAHSDEQSVVLSPLKDLTGEVVGMVYAYRAPHQTNGRRCIRYLEAQLVELLTQSVGCGMSRLEMEAHAARDRVTYQQAFAPYVAAQVELDAKTLRGSEREVTVLFADLRGFTNLCGQHSTGDTYDLLNDVMDALTAAVMDHGGTLIDYYGDGLAAMWNAPVDQADHAVLACGAALVMQETLPEVSDRWEHLLDKPLELGVGLHTGIAQVGNIGSSQRLKYGPRGSTVNLASRLEQATKMLGAPVVATREVVQRLGGQLLDYRICQAELAGIDEPIDIFVIRPASSSASSLGCISRYEEALTQFEAGNLDHAKRLLITICTDCDLPTQFLIDEIDREHNRRLGRRAGDERNMTTTSAISLSPK